MSKTSGPASKAEIEKVRGEEPISRYIFQKNQFSRVKKVVHGAAFMPADDRDTSVFRVEGLTEERVWDIGVNHVEAERKKNGNPQSLKARGDVLAQVAFDQKLQVVAETSEHEKHANITGWPTDESDQVRRAGELALKATLHPRPES